MSETTLEERLDAVERALTGENAYREGASNGNAPFDRRSDGFEESDRRSDGFEESDRRSDGFEELEARVGALEDAVDELQAALQAVRGYVGSVKHVNDEVEDRADAALAKAEAVERALEGAPTDEGADSTPVGRGSRRSAIGVSSGDETADSAENPSDRSDGSDRDEPERSIGHRPVEDSPIGHRPVGDSWLTGSRPAPNGPGTSDRPSADHEGGTPTEGRGNERGPGDDRDRDSGLLDRLRGTL